MLHIIDCHLVAHEQDLIVLLEVEKRLGELAHLPMSAAPLLHTHHTLVCERLCLLCEKRVSYVEVCYDGR